MESELIVLHTVRRNNNIKRSPIKPHQTETTSLLRTRRNFTRQTEGNILNSK